MTDNRGNDRSSAELLRLIYATDGLDVGATMTGQRFTQDSPVLPEVWLAYARKPEPNRKSDPWKSLLINPFMGRRAGLVARELRDVTKLTRVKNEGEEDKKHPDQPAAVAHIPGLVVASLRFEEMLRVALPSTVWWHARIDAMAKALGLESPAVLLTAAGTGDRDAHDAYRDVVAGWIANQPNDGQLAQEIDKSGTLSPEETRMQREFLALMRLVATILQWREDDVLKRARRNTHPPQAPDTSDMSPEERENAENLHKTETREHARNVVDLFASVYEKWNHAPTRSLIWNIALNRDAELSGNASSLSIKADAGRRLFDISCKTITWAMIDSGIDVSSPAFYDWEAKIEERKKAEAEAETRKFQGEPITKEDLGSPPLPEDVVAEALYIDRPMRLYSKDADRKTMMARGEDERGEPTRVIERYDFTDIMRMLDISTAQAMHVRLSKIREVVDAAVGIGDVSGNTEPEFWEIVTAWSLKPTVEGSVELAELRTVNADKMKQMIRRVVEAACLKIGRFERQRIGHKVVEDARNAGRIVEDHVEGLQDVAIWRLFQRAMESAESQLHSLIRRLELGLELDWSILEEFLIDMTPDEPKSPHGTQVAGVLAADWREDEETPKIQGVCPDIRMIDLRVSDVTGKTQEFEAIAALQFILHLNTRSSEKAIHGANISLSIPHDVSNYGCGKTRICEVSEQLVASGVVVVTAAGNGGMIDYNTPGGARYQGYQDGSITDPGNAEAVITVGATHAAKPHQYGVSYFSSRGPTGDGRMKPDLVAPGEKIMTSGLRDTISVVDGTSFSAPHVSGAAALLMARHSELIGQPERIKRVLRETATDLGRDPNFQGAGMLDTLRALQSL